MKLQIKQERSITQTGPSYLVWNVYRDDERIAMCFSADDAREVYEGLLCWAQVRYEATHPSEEGDCMADERLVRAIIECAYANDQSDEYLRELARWYGKKPNVDDLRAALAWIEARLDDEQKGERHGG